MLLEILRVVSRGSGVQVLEFGDFEGGLSDPFLCG